MQIKNLELGRSVDTSSSVYFGQDISRFLKTLEIERMDDFGRGKPLGEWEVLSISMGV